MDKSPMEPAGRLDARALRAAMQELVARKRGNGEIVSPPITEQSPGVVLAKALAKLDEISGRV